MTALTFDHTAAIGQVILVQRRARIDPIKTGEPTSSICENEQRTAILAGEGPFRVGGLVTAVVRRLGVAVLNMNGQMGMTSFGKRSAGPISESVALEIDE